MVASHRKDEKLAKTFEDLTPQIIAGSEHAFRELVLSLGEPLIRYVTRFTRDVHAAEDLVQTCFIRVFRSRKTLKKGSLRPYCFRVARNLASNWARDRALRSEREREAMELQGESTTAHNQVSGAELWELVEELEEKVREPLLLHFAQGLSLAEIGEVLGCAKSTVNTRIQSGLIDLKSKSHQFQNQAVAPQLALLLADADPVTVSPVIIKKLEGAVMATLAKKGVSILTLFLILFSVVFIAGAVTLWSGMLGDDSGTVAHQGESQQNVENADSEFNGSSNEKTNSRANVGTNNGHESGTSTDGNHSIQGDGSTSASGVKTGDSGEKAPNSISDESSAWDEEFLQAAKSNGKPAQDTVDLSSITLSVSGRVLDETGNPVSGATVVCCSPWAEEYKPLATAVSGADGSYFMQCSLSEYVTKSRSTSRLTPGGAGQRQRGQIYSVSLLATAANGSSGIIRKTIAIMKEPAFCKLENSDIVVVGVCTWEVTVQDESGNPVSGATVWLTKFGGNVGYIGYRVAPRWFRADGTPIETITGSSGIARLTAPAPVGSLTHVPILPGDVHATAASLVAKADGYLPGLSHHQKIQAGATNSVTIRLKRDKAITISPIWEAGTPPADVVVTLRYWQTGKTRSLPTIDGNRRNYFTPVWGDSISVSAPAESATLYCLVRCGLRTWHCSAVCFSDSTEIDLPCQPQGHVVRFKTEDGQILQPTRALLAHREQHSGETEGKLNFDGCMIFGAQIYANIDSGELASEEPLWLFARFQGVAQELVAKLPARQATDAVTDITICPPHRGAVLRVKLLNDDNEPLGGVRVDLAPQSAASSSRFFELMEAELESSDSFWLRNQPKDMAHLSGRTRTTSDDSGVALFTHIPDGSYFVRPVRPGYYCERGDIVIKESGDLELILKIRSEPPTQIKLDVSASGGDLKEYSLKWRRVEPSNVSGWTSRRVSNYENEPFEPGTYRFLLTTAGVATTLNENSNAPLDPMSGVLELVQTIVEGEVNDLKFSFQSAATVSIQAYNADGSASDETFEATLFVAPWKNTGPGYCSAPTSSLKFVDGRCEVPSLLPGTYFLNLSNWRVWKSDDAGWGWSTVMFKVTGSGVQSVRAEEGKKYSYKRLE